MLHDMAPWGDRLHWNTGRPSFNKNVAIVIGSSYQASARRPPRARDVSEHIRRS